MVIMEEIRLKRPSYNVICILDRTNCRCRDLYFMHNNMSNNNVRSLYINK